MAASTCIDATKVGRPVVLISREGLPTTRGAIYGGASAEGCRSQVWSLLFQAREAPLNFSAIEGSTAVDGTVSAV